MHETVGEVTHRYLELADESLPGRVTGLYIVGSVALDDYRPGASDVDFVAVTDTPLGDGDVEALARAHARLTEEVPAPAFEGVYVTWEQLAGDPLAIDGVPHHHDGTLSSPTGGGEEAGPMPVRWHTLRTHPVALRGPDAPTVWSDPQALHRWALASLNGYWADWLERQQTLMNRGTMMLADWALERGVLGIPRLHHTLATGKVVSKTGAGEYARATFDEEWHPIIDEALRLRGGGEGEQSDDYRRRPLARRRDALAFMQHVIDDANARHATG